MGVYDTFVSPPDPEDGIEIAVQVKMTNDGDSMPTYKVGDKIPISIPECVIIGNEGYVVIKDGIVILVGGTIYDKWGGLFEPLDIIEERNVIAQALNIKNRVIQDGKKAQEVLRNITDLESPSNDDIEEILDGTP